MGSYSSIGVQPTLCGKSSLVVVCFLCTRIDCIIHLYLQYVLVPFLGGIQDAYDLSTVLWVYGNDLFCYVTCNRNGWYINLLVVREENFRNGIFTIPIRTSKLVLCSKFWCCSNFPILTI